MDNIQIAAFIGMGLNVLMVILFLVSFKGKFKKLYKAYYSSSSWKCITFSAFFKRWFFVLFPFFEALSPLSDSILGESHKISCVWYNPICCGPYNYVIQMRFISETWREIMIHWCISMNELFRQWPLSFLFQFWRIFLSAFICIGLMKDGLIFTMQKILQHA